MSSIKKVQEELEMDMTPMIDCVFLLMIFFVLVIDLSQTDLADLILPKAEYIEPDEKPPELRPILNIVQDGRVVYKKRVQYDPNIHGDNYSTLKAFLIDFKNSLPDEEFSIETIAGREVRLCNTPVLIRADKWTEWHHIGKVMEVCGQPDVAFWKLELAMSEQDKEEKIFKARALGR